MDELISVSASALFANGEFFDLTNDKLTRAYRRIAAMKLFAKHLADRYPEMLQSLQQFVDAQEAAIGCLSNDYSDNTMQRVMPHQQSQTYFEAWEAPFHFIQQATRDRTCMLSHASGNGGTAERQFTGDGTYTAAKATMSVDTTRQNPAAYHYKQGSRAHTRRGLYYV
jgi:hypothetical protein